MPLIEIIKTSHFSCSKTSLKATTRMHVEKSVIDVKHGCLPMRGEYSTMFVTWSVCLMFSHQLTLFKHNTC